jgi:protein ImuB
MLWCALYLSQLPLEVFQRTVDHAHNADVGAKLSPRHPKLKPLTTPSGYPLPTGFLLAVCDHQKVLMASTSAQAYGIHADVKRATALALAPDIALVNRDLAKEQNALSQVATWALQFTPAVSLEPFGLVMEIEASLRLFGGLEAIITQIKAGLHALGFSGNTACAGTASGAWLLAQQSDGVVAELGAQLNMRLANLPLSLLSQAKPHLSALEAIGARTLKDLVQLPRAGMSRRFGKGLLEEIDKALGKIPDLREYFEAPLEFHSKLELMAQVENSEALLFAANRMLVELTGWLSARHCAVKTFQLIAEHDDRGPRLSTPTKFDIHFSEPTREIGRLTGLLREKLAVLKLSAPAHTLHLHCVDVHELPSANGYLFMLPQNAQQSLGRLVEKLQTRLGSHQVQQLTLKEDYRPEAAFKLTEFDTKAASGRVNEKDQDLSQWAHGLPRPLWLMANPLPIEERNQRPYWQGALQLLAGPERIEGGWWDNHFIQRDYFIAEDIQNNLYWIYRERGNHQQSIEPGWFMQGRFG